MKITDEKTVPVLITSTVLKYGREDIRRIDAWVSDEGDVRCFILKPTFHDLKHDSNFTVGIGCRINDNSGAYECIECCIVPGVRKKHPVLITRKLPA